MRRLPTVFLSLLLVAGLLGCDTTATEPETEIVVEAYLQGGAPIDTIRLTRSVKADRAYRPSNAAVRGATVEVRRLSEDGTTAETISFDEMKAGLYAPVPNPPPIVQPLTTYELSATTSDGTELRATTTIPDTISITETQNKSVIYQGPRQPTFTITSPRSSRDQQSVFVLTNTSLIDFSLPEEQLRERLTPFYAEDYDPEEDSIETFRTTSSGLLNEANFSRDEAGRITTELPWISVAFYGPNASTIHVIDDNLYDLFRSQQAQSTGGQGASLGPGEIPNVIEHVKGGTGVFASYVQATAEVQVQPPSGD
jgi:hypothetical protein